LAGCVSEKEEVKHPRLKLQLELTACISKRRKLRAENTVGTGSLHFQKEEVEG
jgi:hypothetical protein